MKFDTTPTDDILTAEQWRDALPIAGEYSKEEENCKGCMGPCGMCTPIETFLSVNGIDIPHTARARIRECLLKGATQAAIDLVPDFLQDAFRRILSEVAYQKRVKDQIFESNKKEIWI